MSNVSKNARKNTKNARDGLIILTGLYPDIFNCSDVIVYDHETYSAILQESSKAHSKVVISAGIRKWTESYKYLMAIVRGYNKTNSKGGKTYPISDKERTVAQKKLQQIRDKVLKDKLSHKLSSLASKQW